MNDSRCIAVLLLAAGVAALATGCGGGKQSAQTNARTGAAGPTGSISSFATAKHCRTFGTLHSQISSAFSHEPGSASFLEHGSRTLQAMADAAPSDIKHALEVIASTFADYVHVIKSSGYDPRSQMQPSNATQRAALVSAAKLFGSTKFSQTVGHLVTWEAHNCKEPKPRS